MHHVVQWHLSTLRTLDGIQGQMPASTSREASMHGASGNASLLFMKGMDGSNEMIEVRQWI